jgi:outer membrane protein OmpA-like peptidoglycan-associated protein
MRGHRIGSRLAAVFLFASGLGTAAGAQGAVAAQVADKKPFSLTERSDFSRYIDGLYVGHAYREARGSLAPEAGGFKGEFLILEETLRDMRSAARRVDRSAPVRLTLARGGALDVQEDSGYPSLRGLPSLPDGDLQPGLTWTAAGTRAFDYDDSGSFVLLPFLAEYRYLGTADYRGKKALSLKARFATRWKGGADSAIIANAAGTHDLDILIDPETLSTLFIRDRFDETFVLAGAKGSGERRSGFSLFFFEASAILDRSAAGEAIVAAVDGAKTAAGPSAAAKAGPLPPDNEAIPEAAKPAPSESLPPGAGAGPLIAGEGSALADGGEFAKAGLELDTSPEGIVLRVKDLRFVADSDAILSTELWRLDAIAAALKALPGRSFLVAGHSAAVGKAAGELELSIQRAKRVTDELAARGIEPTRLLYRGFGSSKPLASNDTEDGRAKNRRVEITILE